MEREDLLERLQEVGLTEYQSRAYLAAVHLGTGRPNDLAEASGVPQARIYDVIDDLSDRGLVEVHERSGGKEISAPPPRAVLEAFKQRHVDQFAETVDGVIAGLEQFHHAQEYAEGFVSMVATRESAVRHVRQAVESAEWWLSLALPVDLYEEVAAAVAGAIDRGVTVRLVIPEDDEPVSETMTVPDGLNLRSRPLADTMAVADREYGVFSTRSPRGADQPYVITQESTLVFLFQNYFDQFWPGSTVLQADTSFPRRYLVPWRAIVDLRERLRQGETFRARVVGFQNRLQRTGTWEGPIVDYELSGPVPAEYTVVFPAKAALFVEIEGDRWEVGGPDATKAHVAADGLEIWPE